MVKSSFFTVNRNVCIAGSVLLFHALAIWALQTGLLMRAIEIIVPVEMLAQMVELPTPKADPAPPKPPEPVKQVVNKTKQVAQVAPTLLVVADATPTPNAPSVQPIAPPAPYEPAIAVAAVAAPAPPAPSAVPKIVRPSSDLAYLKNPEPVYERLSRAMREQGVVKLRIFVSSTGLPQKIDLMQSSGYERLDKSALDAVRLWQFVPGTRDGIAEAMSADVSIPFILKP